MSRLTGADALGLFEAYQAVYNPQELTEEQVWEEVETWVNDLIEEGYDLSDYTWEEMYESYISEAPQGDIGARVGRGLMGALRDLPSGLQGQLAGKDNAALQRQRQRAQNLRTLLTTGRVPTQSTPTAKPQLKPQPQQPLVDKSGKNVFDGTSTTKTTLTPIKNTPETPRPPASIPQSAPRRSAPAPAASRPRPAATPAAAAQTGDKAKDMDTWAKANPKLAAASAERDRTRGTSATTNPLMKDMKSRLPAPKTPSPTTSSTVFSKSTPSLGSSTPEVKSAGTSSGSAGFGKSAPSIGSSAFKPSPASAAPTPTPTTAAATTPAAKPALKKPIVSGFDMFDVVKGYLIGEGYADTEEAALAIMTNMSEEWRQSIVEGDNYDKNRQRAAKRAAERNAARDAGKTGNVPGVGYVTSRRERETYRDSAGTERHTSGARMPKKDVKESF